MSESIREKTCDVWVQKKVGEGEKKLENLFIQDMELFVFSDSI